MQGIVDRYSPEAMERLREAVRTRVACDLTAERAGTLPPNPAVTAAEIAALDADDAEISRVVASMGAERTGSAPTGDDVVISHELARYLARTLDAAARFAEQMPLYVHRADVGSWSTHVKVSSTEAAMKLRRAVLAGELPNEAVALDVALDAAPARAGSAA